MIKKITLPILIIAIILQFIVPVSMIFYSRSIETQVQDFGTEFVMDININSIMNGKVIFSPDESDLWCPLYDNEYVSIATNENGKAYCTGISKQKPDGDDYLNPSRRNTNRLDNYEVDYGGKILSSSQYNLYEIDAYITAKVYKGNISVTGLYIEGLPVEKWIAEFEDDSIIDNGNEMDFDDEIVWEEENLFDE